MQKHVRVCPPHFRIIAGLAKCLAKIFANRFANPSGDLGNDLQIVPKTDAVILRSIARNALDRDVIDLILEHLSEGLRRGFPLRLFA